MWPFTQLTKLRDELAIAKSLEEQRDKDFLLLHGRLSDQAISIKRLLAEKNELTKLLTKTKNDLENERMSLVACGVGAMSNTRESAHNNRITKENPFYNASVGDVYAAVDREIALRESLDNALDRIGDMLKADDGQAWKEAEKFFLKYRSTKNCIKCGSEMIPMHSEDKKLCSNGACGHEVPWTLEDGQRYMYKQNVEPFNRHLSEQEAESARPDLSE